MDSVIEKCGERHGGARRGVGGWARVTAVGVASSEEKGGQARPGPRSSVSFSPRRIQAVFR